MDKQLLKQILRDNQREVVRHRPICMLGAIAKKIARIACFIKLELINLRYFINWYFIKLQICLFQEPY